MFRKTFGIISVLVLFSGTTLVFAQDFFTPTAPRVTSPVSSPRPTSPTFGAPEIRLPSTPKPSEPSKTVWEGVKSFFSRPVLETEKIAIVKFKKFFAGDVSIGNQTFSISGKIGDEVRLLVKVPQTGETKVSWSGPTGSGVFFKPLAAPPPPCTDKTAIDFAKLFFAGGQNSRVAKFHKAIEAITNIKSIREEKIAKLTELILLIGPYYDLPGDSGPIKLDKDSANKEFGGSAPINKTEYPGAFGEVKGAFSELANEFKETFGIGAKPAPPARSLQGIAEVLKNAMLSDLATAAMAGSYSGVGGIIAGGFGLLEDEGVSPRDIENAKKNVLVSDISNFQGLPNLNRALDNLLKQIQGYIDEYNKSKGSGGDPCPGKRKAMEDEIKKQLENNQFDLLGEVKAGANKAGIKAK